MADKAPESTPESQTTTVNLHNDITVNGVKYRAGQGVKVPKDQADDIARIDYNHQQYKENLHRKRVYEENLGNSAVGGA